MFIIVIEVLGALLFTGLAGWPARRAFGARRSPGMRPGPRVLWLAGTLSTITFSTAFFVLQMCAQRLRLDNPPTSEVKAQSSPSPPLALAAGERSAPASPFVEQSTRAGDSAQAAVRENQRADRYGGYQAGFALAIDPKHRGSKISTKTVLDAIVTIRCKGRSADFEDGFRRGYVAGMAGG